MQPEDIRTTIPKLLRQNNKYNEKFFENFRSNRNGEGFSHNILTIFIASTETFSPYRKCFFSHAPAQTGSLLGLPPPSAAADERVLRARRTRRVSQSVDSRVPLLEGDADATPVSCVERCVWCVRARISVGVRSPRVVPSRAVTFHSCFRGAMAAEDT